MNLEFIKKYCMFNCFYLQLHFGFCTAYTGVYAFHHINNWDNAILKILMGLAATGMLVFLKNNNLRGWTIKNYGLFAVLGIIIDGITELLLLTDPLVKLICDVVALATFFKLYRVQLEERSGAIFNVEERKNERQQFNINTEIYANLGTFIGGLLAMIFPNIPIEVVIWTSAIWASSTYLVSAYRFYIMDVYIAEHKLIYPYMQKKNGDD